jgi:PAS domain S-box-containing protein
MTPWKTICDTVIWILCTWEGVIGIMTVGTSIAVWFYRHMCRVAHGFNQIARIGTELSPNSGTSLYDVIHNVAIGITSVRTDIDRMEKVVTIQSGVVHQLCTELGVAIFHTDRYTNCQWASPEWCVLSGMAVTEAIGQGWRSAIDPRDRERVDTEWDRCTESACLFRGEFRFLRPDGMSVWVSCRATPVKSADGNLASMIAGCRPLQRPVEKYEYVGN